MNISQIEKENEDNDRARDEYIVKTLNHWDDDHVKTQKGNFTFIFIYIIVSFFQISKNKTMTKLVLSSSINSANYLNRLRNTVNNENLNSKIQNLFLRNDKERGAMVLHNVEPTTKAAFNFQVFLEKYKDRTNVEKNGGKRHESILNSVDDTRKLQEILQVSNSSDNKADESRKISENIMNNPLNHHIRNQEFYRSVVAEKSKIENILRKELLDVAEKLHLRKYDRNKALDEIASVVIRLNKLKVEFLETKESHDKKILSLGATLINSNASSMFTAPFSPSKKNTEKGFEAKVKFNIGNSMNSGVNSYINANIENITPKSSSKNSLEKLTLNGSIKEGKETPGRSQKKHSVKNEEPIETKIEKAYGNSSLEFKTVFLKKRNFLEEDFKKKEKKYFDISEILQNDINERKKSIKRMEVEVNLLKNHFNSLSKDQRLYYLDVLVNGIDVR